MSLKDYITALGILVSTIIVIGGWFFSQYKDREAQKHRVHLTSRLELYGAFCKVRDALVRTEGNTSNDPDYLDKILNLTNCVRVYGTQSENMAFDEFVDAFMVERDLVRANSSLNKLRRVFVDSIRNNIGASVLDWSKLL